MFLHTFGIDKISITSAQMATGRDVALILGVHTFSGWRGAESNATTLS